MTDDATRCRRCQKAITPPRTYCQTCETVETDTGDAMPAAPEPCGGEADGGCGETITGCCGGD